MSFKKEILNLPNLISLVRIILLLPFIIFLSQNNYVKAGVIFLISGISDLLDGFIARKLNSTTKLGKILDPVADKLNLIVVILCIGSKICEIKFFVILLVLKEVIMILASVFLLKKNIFPPKSKWYGKLSTASFYFSVILIIALKVLFKTESPNLNIILMSVTVIFMMYAFYKYSKNFLLIYDRIKSHDNQ
ncbi:MAG: CDP-alcohol phosphatidyltransferase family protein [Candidatus Paraimprobicoccus trichonymphae]|uniref:Phosphatidylglycerophosphate synthase n=1 Tax=Candidatus Paraimprobicoccus trichonymphae TaxID=3033793 RepID=A0AA48KVW0_9FIRM|nr:MAG: CDP-alcohol phosphatidyltransferase family protein [Candidatus Paraimprobicoccus trichonymphae]